MVEEKAILNNEVCLWLQIHEGSIGKDFEETIKPTEFDGALYFKTPQLIKQPYLVKDKSDTITVYYKNIPNN